MKQLLFAFTAIIILQVNGFAQTVESKSSFLQFIGGYGYADQNDIILFYPPETNLNSNHFTLGFQMLYEKNRFVRGFTGETVFVTQFENDSLRITQETGSININVGYVVINQQRLSIYPIAGIGGGISRIQNTLTNDIDFNSIQNNAFTESNFYQYQLIGDIGVATSFIVGAIREENENRQSGLSLGIQIGYTYGFPIGDWKFTGGNLLNSPAYTISMPYAKLLFGFHGK